MKKIICIIAIAVVSLSIMVGCQKTPESPVVVGKDNDKMIETAESLEDKSLTIREQVSAPESVKMNFKDQSGKIKFSVDAEVIVPDAEASKIIRVTAHEITQDEVDAWTELLFADETLYTLESFDQPTKGKITEELLKLKKQLAELGEFEGETVTAVEVPANDSNGESEEAIAKEYTKADQLREAIAGYEELLKSAPETPEMTETTNKLQSVNDASVVQFAVPADDNSAVRGFSAANWGYAHPIIYTDRGESQFVGNSYIVSLEEMDLLYISAGDTTRANYDEYRKMSDPAITSEEAIKLGDDFLQKLDMDGYVISRADLAISEPSVTTATGEFVGNVLKGWRLEYRREIDGVPVSYSDVQMASPDAGESWCYERIVLFVTDDGIAEAYIEELNDVGETVVENCKLMSFDDIVDIFKKMMPVQYNTTALGDGILDAEYNVTSIEFGYTRISEENTDYSGLLVPTWSFYGTQTITYKSDSGEFVVSNSMNPILTINAIDGSIIDRYAGY